MRRRSRNRCRGSAERCRSPTQECRVRRRGLRRQPLASPGLKGNGRGSLPPVRPMPTMPRASTGEDHFPRSLDRRSTLTARVIAHLAEVSLHPSVNRATTEVLTALTVKNQAWLPTRGDHIRRRLTGVHGTPTASTIRGASCQGAREVSSVPHVGMPARLRGG